MKKLHLNLTFIILIILLIFLFIYNGLDYSEEMTESMAWKSAKFKMTPESKFIGILLVLSFPFYFVLRKKIKNKQ